MLDQEAKDNFNTFLPDGVPSFLHKYSAITPYLVDSLLNGYLWHSSPRHFNDPYDCYKHLVYFEPTDEDIRDLFSNTLKLKGDELERRVVEQKNNRGELQDAYNKTLQDNIYAHGICSFTTNYENTLMWSHYADHHRGICLAFEPMIDPPAFLIHKVRYTDDFIPKNYFGQPRGQSVVFMLTTKSDEWAYEKEYRSLNATEGAFAFDKKALRAIIFGCRTSHGDMAKIMHLIKTSGYKHVKFGRAVNQPNSFKLAFDTIHPKNV